MKSAQTQISQYLSAAFWVVQLVRRRQNGPAYSFCSEEDLKMRQFDFTPYRRSTVGFDRLFDLLENSARLQQADNYPPFNIERLSDERYRITLAVSGFRAEDIHIVAQQNLLQITGRKDEEGDRQSTYELQSLNRH